MPDKADKEDHIHDWSPPHLRQDTPAVRAANKASARTVAGKEAPAAIDEAVKEAKHDERAAAKAAKK